MSVRTRFAPSPTGHVHIGNIRAAIYNWLFSRHEGGAFLLRVEDTDRERSTPEAIDTLLKAMEWMGLDVDEEPLYQSTRMEAHLAAAEDLLARGLAYKEDKGNTGRGEAVIFRMPEGDLEFEDEIKGTLRKPGDSVEDLVIVRSNGTPVFHLANVLDDIEMNITHVIRGDDHIENTYRHVALYQALGAPVPKFAHLPMIVNDRGKPYSKRDGDAYVGDFRDKGYLPEALFNYLTLLGWSPGDDREVMERAEIVEAFQLRRVRSSASRMDLDKLYWMNGEYMRRLPAADYQARCIAELKAAGSWDDGLPQDYIDQVFNDVQDRIKLPTDAIEMAGFFFTEDYPFHEKGVRKRLQKEGAKELLASLNERFKALSAFNAESTEAALRELSEEREVGAGALFPPLRVAVSGAERGPSLFDMLETLGQDRVTQRIDRALERFSQ